MIRPSFFFFLVVVDGEEESAFSSVVEWSGWMVRVCDRGSLMWVLTLMSSMTRVGETACDGTKADEYDVDSAAIKAPAAA